MFFKNKKGLELPITAIIVLIISITFLGLAVYFIKTMFGGGTEIIGGELAKIKGELRKSLEESGESFTFSSGGELEIKRGEPFKFYIGVRNTAGSKKCYRLEMSCLKAFNPDGKCTETTIENAFVGGRNKDGQTADVDIWFPKILSEFTVESGDVDVNPVTLQVAKALPDTYLMEARLYADDGGTCQSFTDSTPLTKRFHIVLS